MTNEQTITFLLSQIIKLNQGINLVIDNSIALIENKQYEEAQQHLKDMKKVLADLEFGLVVYLWDCLEELKNIPNNSIDCIVTDPPYQLSSITKPRLDQVDEEGNSFNPFYRVQARKGFMGKEWDVLPPIEVWEECLRVLKPGAFAFIMTTSRQGRLGQILMDITQAGFRTDFSSIYWTYSSGFPKATNISKILDKRLGYEREVIENRKVTKNMAE